MSKLKRFYYVHGPRSLVAHMADHITEGYRTWCGLRITARWVWLRKKRRGSKRGPICKKCRRAS